MFSLHYSQCPYFRHFHIFASSNAYPGYHRPRNQKRMVTSWRGIIYPSAQFFWDPSSPASESYSPFFLRGQNEAKIEGVSYFRQASKWHSPIFATWLCTLTVRSLGKLARWNRYQMKVRFIVNHPIYSQNLSLQFFMPKKIHEKS